MSNIVVALKQEMARIARREIRSQTAVLQRSSAKQRREIAKLKREIVADLKELPLLGPVTREGFLELLHSESHRLTPFKNSLDDVRRQQRSPDHASDITLRDAFGLTDGSKARVLSAGDLPIPLTTLCNELEQGCISLT